MQGDSDGARCLAPPYTVSEGEDDVVVELPLPFWTEAEDVRVDVGASQMRVRVRGGADICRTYWRNR
jgi:HSP20 family molecular chaperone IbpA